MDNSVEVVLLGALLGILISMPAIFVALLQKKKEDEFIQNHRKIHVGMTRMQVIDILGDNFTQSCLKNDVEKLEWRYRRNGYTGRIARGAYIHTSSLTRRISVKFKEGKVIEVNSINMD